MLSFERTAWEWLDNAIRRAWPPARLDSVRSLRYGPEVRTRFAVPQEHT